MAHLPAKLGPFEPLHRLGAGGMAETFVAVRRGPGGFEQRVCIKRILPAYVGDQSFVAAFLAEARTSAALRHANIVQVLDFGLAPEDGSYYLALELVDGLDLRALAEQGAAFDAALVILIASELASALEYAHAADDGRARVVHRDLSPSNVLVSRAGEVKLTDFGIARVVGGAPRTATGVIKGKVPYMPPEYIEGSRFDERGDLFALGVLLFELLHGERPFDGESDLDTLRRIVAGERRRFRAKAPTPLIQCIERLLRKNPDERFPSAQALLGALPPIQVHATRKRLADIVRARVPSTPRVTPVRLSEVPTSAPEWSGGAPGASGRERNGEARGFSAEWNGDARGSFPPERNGERRGPARDQPAVNPIARTVEARAGARERGDVPASAAQLAAALPVRAPIVEPTRTSYLAPARGGPSKLALLALAAAAAALFTVALLALLKLESRLVGAAEPLPPVPTAIAATATAPSAATPAAPSPSAPVGPPSEGEGEGKSESESESSPNRDEAGSEPQAADVPLPTPPANLPVSAVVEAHAGVRERNDADLPARAGAFPSRRSVRRPARAQASEASAASRRAQEPSASAQASAELRIVVVPFGEVWVDDRYLGQSPLSVKLAPGSHELAVGEGRARERRTIQVTAGQHEELTLRLPPAPKP